MRYCRLHMTPLFFGFNKGKRSSMIIAPWNMEAWHSTWWGFQTAISCNPTWRCHCAARILAGPKGRTKIQQPASSTVNGCQWVPLFWLKTTELHSWLCEWLIVVLHSWLCERLIVGHFENNHVSLKLAYVGVPCLFMFKMFCCRGSSQKLNKCMVDWPSN